MKFTNMKKFELLVILKNGEVKKQHFDTFGEVQGYLGQHENNIKKAFIRDVK